MTAANDGSYSEICLIGITQKDGSEVQFASYVELDSIDPPEGSKEITTTPMANGGRIVKKTPQGDNEVTLKLYEIEIGSSASLAQAFHGTTDSTAPLQSQNTHTRPLFRVAFLWTDDTAATTAGGATASGNYARRLVFEDLRMTEYKEAVEDGTLVANVKFMGPAFTQADGSLVTRQSVASSDGSGLSALSSYT